MDISANCKFEPSLRPEDLVVEFPSRRESRGLAFLLQDRVLLGVVASYRGPRWECAYLDIGTGEILQRIETDRAHVTRRWRIVRHREERDVEVMTEFPLSAPVGEA